MLHWLQKTETISSLLLLETLSAITPEAVAILDLRKNDFVGGKIKGAFNIPAQSTTHSIEDIYNLFDNAGKKQIIVHCASSKNRATRVWGWLTDYANTKPGSERLNISILKGGYNAFKEEPENSDLIDN